MKKNHQQIRKSVMLSLVLAAALPVSIWAQCFPSQKYDKIVSGYHQSIALKSDGSYACWGQTIDSTGAGTGSSAILSPQDINVTHYPRLTGTPLKAAIGGSGSSTGEQFLLLTTTHLFAWGTTGSVIASSFTSSSHFMKIAQPTGGDTTGLPAGVTPSHVTMMFATYQTLAIVTDSGFVYMLTQAHQSLQGDSTGSLTSTTWHKVKINAGTYLTNVTAVRGQVSTSSLGAFMAITSNGTVYTWGPSVFRGNGTTGSASYYATPMTLPSEFTGSNKPILIGVTGGTKNSGTDSNTYYILSDSGYMYALGGNKEKQCGDFTITTRYSWVNCCKRSGVKFDNVSYFSAQEADDAYPSVAVVTKDSSILYAWGYSSKSMLGEATDAAYDPEIPAGFTKGADTALFPEVGGHTLVYLHQGSSKFCYVGHKIDGSMGDSVSTNTTVASFDCSNTPSVWICGGVPVEASTATSTISVSPTQITANGLTTATVTVQLKTSVAQGDTNLTTTGGTVTMSTTSGTLGIVTDHNNGTYTATLTSSSVPSTATISFTIQGATGSNTAKDTFNIAPITGANSFRVDNNITLADASTGGTWSSSNTGVATVGTSGVVSGVTAGTVTITYTDGGQNATYSVTVNPIGPITGPTGVTAGKTIQLADTTAGGTWSSSNTALATIGTSGIVTGVSSGTLTITYTVGSKFVTYAVTVNPIGPITGANGVTVGKTIALADTTAGGTWSSSNTALATIGTSGIVTGVASGSLTITYTVGSQYVTYAITVNPIGPITGPVGVTAGKTITLADTTTGGTWSSSNGALATIGTSGVVTGVAQGAVTITYTVGSKYVTYAITVNPIGPITGPNGVTAGNSITLADTTAGGTWSSSNTALATIGTSGVMTGVASGSLTITYTVGSQFVTYAVTVNPIGPITGQNGVTAGKTITLSDTTAGGTWSSSNTSLATIGTSGIVTGLAAGTLTITYTVGSKYVTYPVTVNPIGPITGATSVYAGNSITLADTTAGGTWSSSNTAIGSIGTGGVLTGISAGALTITYTVGAQYVTYAVTVNAIAPITGPNAVNTSSTITLSDVTPGGTWSSSNTGLATIGTSGVVTGVAAGVVTITYTVGGNYVVYAVTVNSASAITGTTSVCIGGTTTLACTPAGGTWTSASPLIAAIGSASGIVSGVAAGTAVISYTYSGTTHTTTLTVNSLPVVAAISGANGVCVGNTITLSDATGSGVWSSGSAVATVGSASGVVTGVAMGAVNISYTVTDVNSCSAYVTYPVDIEGVPEYLYTFTGLGTNVTSGDGGPASLASIQGPRAMVADTAGNLYFCDATANYVRKISANGYIYRVAGNGTVGNTGDGGQATAASLNMGGGGGIYVDKAGNIYIACTGANTIRKVSAATGIISTICGTGVAGFSGDGGPASAAKIQLPLGITEDTSGNIYFADQCNYRIRKINASNGIISTIIGTGSNYFSGDGGAGTNATLSVPRDVVADRSGNLYIVDNGNNRIRKYVIATGIITTYAGTGVAGSSGDGGQSTSAQLNCPARAVFDGSDKLYIADQNNNKIRRISLNTGIITTVVATGSGGFAGDGGPSINGQIYAPCGIAFNKNGHLFLADGNNRRIRIAPYMGSIAITSTLTSVPHGSPVTFTAYSSITANITAMQWQKNGSNVGTGGLTYTDVPSSAGTNVYRCIMSVSPECSIPFSDTSNAITVTATEPPPPFEPTSVSILGNADIKVFPNPVHGVLNVEVAGLEDGIVQIKVTDQLGRVKLVKNNAANGGLFSDTIDMTQMADGIYFISVSDKSANSSMVKCIKN